MKEIKVEPKKEIKESEKTILFLGSSDTGKTVLFRNISFYLSKQFFSDEEIVSIYNTLIQNLNQLIQHVDFKNLKDFDIKYYVRI